MDPVFAAILSAVCSGGVCLFLGHYLTKDRDARMRAAIQKREAEFRRRQFRRVISKWRYSLTIPQNPDNTTIDPWRGFSSAIAEISSEFALCDSDFPNSRRIGEIICGYRSLHPDQEESKMRKTGVYHSEHYAALPQDLLDATNEEAQQDETRNPH
jgi:hypothetical protein